MPGFVEEINKPMSDESFKTYAGVIGFLMKKGVDVAAERFEKRISGILKKANRDDKITLPTTAFYISDISPFILRRGSFWKFQGHSLKFFIRINLLD